MVLGQLAVNMLKDANLSILIYLNKAEVQMDQGPSYKTRNNETNRRESGEEPRTNGHRGNFSAQYTNILCSKIKN